MNELGKSLVVGLVTVLFWYMASIESNTKKQTTTALTSTKNKTLQKDSSIETLTMNYKDANIMQKYNR